MRAARCGWPHKQLTSQTISGQVLNAKRPDNSIPERMTLGRKVRYASLLSGLGLLACDVAVAGRDESGRREQGDEASRVEPYPGLESLHNNVADQQDAGCCRFPRFQNCVHVQTPIRCLRVPRVLRTSLQVNQPPGRLPALPAAGPRRPPKT